MGIFADLMYDEKDPKNVAKAYSLMNERMREAEEQKKEEAWDMTFDSLKQRGFSPSAALTGGENSMGQLAPGTGQGSGYQEPDPLTRWKQQVDAMVNSGNPVLQKEGLNQLSQYHSRATTPDKLTETRSNAAKMADDIGLTGAERAKFIERYAFKTQFQPKLTTVSDAKSLAVKPDQLDAFQEQFGRTDIVPGMDMAAITPFIEVVDPAEQAKEGKAGAVVGEFEDLLFGEGGLYAGKEGKGILGVYGDALNATIQQYTQSNPKFKQYEDLRKGSLANIIRQMGESGNLAVEDIARGERLIPTTQLPFPDSAEVARLKVDSLKRMMSATTKEEAAKILDEAEAKLDKAKVKEGANRKVGETWEDGTYLYRKAPDGSVQRRAK